MNNKNSGNSEKDRSKYTLDVHAEGLGLGGEYIGYSFKLKEGKKTILESGADNICDLGSKLITVLMEHTNSPVDVRTSGVFYHNGSRLVEDIVDLHNSRYI